MAGMSERDVYRSAMHREGLVSFRVKHKETDLHIQALEPVKAEVSTWVMEARIAIEEYGRQHPSFFSSLSPLPLDQLAPPIVQEMMVAASKANVGPMAAVAGAVAQYVGLRCRKLCGGEVLVENGGDVFVWAESPVVLAIWAGHSPLSGKMGIKPLTMKFPLGICTSSGTIGHSKSFGLADAVTVVAESCPLADAAATAIGNLVKGKADIQKGLRALAQIPGVAGGVIITGKHLGAWGNIELTAL